MTKSTTITPTTIILNRIDIFKKYGFKTLVIWERELKGIDKLIKKLAEFEEG